jgi:hypothetical protein
MTASAIRPEVRGREPDRFPKRGAVMPAALAFAVVLGLLPAPPSRAAGPVPATVAAAQAAPTPAADPAEPRSGTLRIRTADGFIEAPRLGTDVQLTVSGPTVRARVTQAFTTPRTATW